MKHTPGPAVRVQFFDADGHVIAEATGKPCATYRAAPDLLAMLNAAVFHLERVNHFASLPDIDGQYSASFSTPESEMEKFRAAIAKAEQS